MPWLFGCTTQEPASGAFRNAQALAKAGAADALLGTLKNVTSKVDDDSAAMGLAGPLCIALKTVAANEEVRTQILCAR